MNIIPKHISKIKYKHNKLLESYQLFIYSNENKLTVINGNSTKLDESILHDLISKKAYATSLLYFSENVMNESKYKQKLQEDIDILLHKNIQLVEEVAPLLVKINGYPIYEGENYILRGDGKVKVKECFEEESEEDLVEEAEGTQASDIAPKIDYTNNCLGPKNKKYKPYTVDELNESTHINLKGFIKDPNGNYVRNNFILVEEVKTGKIKAIHRNEMEF